MSGALCISQEVLTRRGAVDTDGIDPVTVPVTRDRQIGRRAEGQFFVGLPRRVRIP